MSSPAQTPVPGALTLRQDPERQERAFLPTRLPPSLPLPPSPPSSPETMGIPVPASGPRSCPSAVL